MYCPIPISISAPTKLELLSTTPGTSTVLATYDKLTKGSNSWTILATAKATGAGTTPSTTTATITDTYDPSNFIYYVEVDLSRRSTADNPTLYLVTVH